MKLDFIINTLALIFFISSAMVFGLVGSKAVNKAYEGEVLGGYSIDEDPTVSLEELPESTATSLNTTSVTNITNVTNSDGFLFNEAFEWIESPYRLLVIPQTYFEEDAHFRKDVTIEGGIEINDIDYIFPDEDNEGILSSDGQGNLTWEEIEAGITDFLGLSDTPDSYSGENSSFVAVNSTGTGLEFVDAPTGTTISGTDNRLARFNLAGDNVEDSSLNDLYTGGVALTVDSTGQVGIGTTGPSYKLDVAGTGRAWNLIAHNVDLSGLSTSIITGNFGFDGYTNFSGGIGTGGISKDSITGAQRLTSTGNLVNIGSIQAGEISVNGGGTFATKVDYTANRPFGIDIGDVNGDGKSDVITASTFGSVISVFINNGDGTFASGVTYSPGAAPYAVATGDLNGDGMLDIVTANFSASRASVFLNNGDGTFATSVNYVTGTSPLAVAVGDVNGDGKADFAVSNVNSNSASVFINNGDGTFAAKVDYAVGAAPQSVAIGDVDGDGKADLAVGNFSDTSVSILINNGNGTFATKVDYPATSTPESVVLGDVNGDGMADMFTADQSANTVSVFINDGDGTFAAKVDYAAGSNPEAVTVGDVNGDGKADLAAANWSSNSVSIFINNGNGTFATKVDYGVGTEPEAIAMGDLNGDGKADLAVANGGETTMSILINNFTPILMAQASTGRVGIGTTGPGSKLSVAGSVGIGSTYASYAAPTNGLLVQGAVGIGTTNPGSNALAVAGHIAPSANDLYDLGSDAFRFRDLYIGGETLHIGTSTSDEYAIGYDTTNNRLGFNVNGTGNAEFVFDSNGRLGIGTTAPSNMLTMVGGNFMHTAGSNPVLAGTYSAGTNFTTGVSVIGKYAYTADSLNNFSVIDITRPTNPALLGNINLQFTAWDVYAAGEYVYVAARTGGLIIVDVSNPSSPVIAGQLDTAGDAWSVFVSGKYAYLASDTAGMQIIDVSDPQRPTLVGTYDSPDAALGVFVSGKYAYLADNLAGMRIVDVSNPASPSLIGTYNTPGIALNTYVSGRYAYITDSGADMYIVDVNTPSSPTLVGTYTTTSSQSIDVSVAGRYAYVAESGDGLAVVDISNPALPVRVGTLDTSDARTAVISGKYAYVADIGGGLRIIDINGAETPTLNAGAIQSNNIYVSENMNVGNNLHVKSGLTVGRGGATFNGIVGIGLSSAQTALQVKQNGTGDIFNLFDGANNIFTVKDGGSVGIGTTAGGSTLSISGSTAIGALYSGFAAPTNGMLIQGSVGIGRTSPAYALDILGGARSTGVLTQSLVLSAASTSVLTSQPGFSGFTNFSAGIGTGIQSDSLLGMQRITTAGNLVNIGSIQAGEVLLSRGGTLVAKVDYTGLSSGSSVAMADYNSDGAQDVAVTNDNFSVNTISVYMNNGDGTYAAKVDYATGTSPRHATTSDFNGDGKADLAVANGSGNGLSVFINNGDGTFATKVDYASNSSSFGITSGDVNGDGKADIVVGSITSANLSVYINNGDGTFAAKADVSSGTTSGVVLADVNGDSKLDLIGVNSTSDVISVHFNNGNGTFAARSTYGAGDNPEMGAVGDVSGDGKPDIAVGNISDNDMSVFINNGDGTFATKVDYATGAFPRGITMGDITGDGKADIAVASANDGNISVFINNGSGTFAAKVDYTAGSSVRGVKIGDVNKDGRADIVSASTSNMSVFINSTSPMLFAQASTGNVGLGTTGPGSKLSVAGAVGIGATYAAYSAPANGMLVQGAVGIGTTNPGSHALSVVGTAGLSTGTAWTNTSDRRFKDEQSELYGSALSKISQLRPVTYEWNELHTSIYGEDPGLNYGFIAQEIGEIIPEMVTQDSSGYYYYNPSGFEAILTAAVQEQQDMIDELRERLEEIDSAQSESGETEEDPNLDLDFDVTIPEGLESLGEILKIEEGDGRKRTIFFSDMNVSGNVTADSFSTLGEITVGFLTINSVDNSISVLGGEPLKLQNGINAGDVDFFNGKLVINPEGGITSKSEIHAKAVVTEKVAVLGAEAIAVQLEEDSEGITSDSTVGEGSLSANQLEVTVNNINVTPDSKIFVMPTTGTGGKVLNVKTKSDGSFIVAIDSAHDAEIKFDYWIIEVR